MPSRAAVGLTATAAIALLVGGCARDLDPLGPASFPPDPAIFLDGFGAGVGFAAFGGSKADAVDIDQVVRYTGDAALQITIPDFGDPTGSYAGGAFVTNTPRDLSGFNALTFWARASRNLTLDVAGLGNDNTGTSMFSAETSGLAVTTTWSKFVVPIPDASRLAQERGMFFFAEGPENQQGAILWVDELQYEQMSGLSAPRPAINTQSIRTEVGGSAQVAGTRATYTFDGRDVTVGASASYFTYASSDQSVATVDESGLITVVAEGIATITAALNGVQAEGAVEVRTALPPQGPAPTPTQDAANVISLFSDAYDDVTVDTWRTSWSNATLEDVTIGGNATKKYTNLGFAGIETVSQQIDISEMTHISMDFYTSDETPASAEFRIELVDFGPNGVFDGGDDTKHQLILTPASNPGIATDQWVTLDIPLSSFPGMTGRNNFAQMVLAAVNVPPNTVYLDNVFFYKLEVPSAPPAPAPTPTLPAANVISLFSDAYTDVTVDTWSASWDAADEEDVLIEGNTTKKYSNHIFAGILTESAAIDISAMTHVHLDLWTPDDTADPKVFRIKMVDFGPNGTFDGPGNGDDTEHEVVLSASSTPALGTGRWISIEIPMSDFVNMTTRQNLSQIVFSGDLSTFFIDNFYFHN